VASELGGHPGKPSEQSVSKRSEWSFVRMAAERSSKVSPEKWLLNLAA